MKFLKSTFKRSPVVTLKKFLADKITVCVPGSWQELSDREAWRALRLLSMDDVESEHVPLLLFMELNKFSVLGRSHRGDFIVSGGGTIFELTPSVAAEMCRPLRFVLEPPKRPWRPERFRKYIAVDADMQGLCFADWLCVENYLQRVISISDFSLLDNLNIILMKRSKGFKSFLQGRNVAFTRPERLAVFLWIQSVKDYLRRRFPHFYARTGEAQEGAITPQDLQDATDAQIRALTKGDITKENQVLEMDMYRALSELNALAREYKELDAKLNSK